MTCPHSRNRPLAPLFELSPHALARQREGFVRQLRRGLARDGQRIAALPAWLPRPTPGLAGLAVVVDIGGTNVRAALLSLRADGGHELLAAPETAMVPGVGDSSVSREVLFDTQAELVARLSPPAGIPLGYCFSYPARVLPEGDAVLLRWTKDIRVGGVEGERVGALLRTALERRGVQVGGIRVLNDTVAALLAGAGADPDGRFEHAVGLVVGTGSNMASYLPAASIGKLSLGGSGGSMAVNLESGNLELCELTGWDLQLDAASDNPGSQGFEKAVSGRYLPRLLTLATEGMAPLDSALAAGALVALRDQDHPRYGELAGAILDRSSDLVACGLAALLDCLGPGRCQVVAEGGLFWNAPNFRARVEATLAALLGDSERVRIARIADANLVGAAVAALGPLWADQGDS